jgi:hypothetical protein
MKLDSKIGFYLLQLRKVGKSGLFNHLMSDSQSGQGLLAGNHFFFSLKPIFLLLLYSLELK